MTTDVRYKVGNSMIRTENAAKSMRQTSTYLVEWLRERDPTDSALDYGCGKLRYTAYIAEKSPALGIVDSEIQLTRIQRIGDQDTSVAEYAASKWPGCRIYTVFQFLNGIQHQYDFALCANVLSVIPCKGTRAKSLVAIRRALSDEGELLVTNQHTNSYFKTIGASSKSRPHLDGWITESKRGPAYYGILTKEKVVLLLESSGFQIKQAWIAGQSNYVLARRRQR